MKKFILVLSLVFSVTCSFSNILQSSEAYISELYFDENDDWTIEVYFRYYDSENDTGYVLITSTDTAFFKKFPDSTNFLLLTVADLDHPLTIEKTGDKFWFENWIGSMGSKLTAPFKFGNYPGSTVNPPYPGQSLVFYSHMVVKDTAQSLGFRRTPPKGVIRGHIYDSIGNPLPFIRIQSLGIKHKILWSDSDGFYSDSLFSINAPIVIYNGPTEKIYDAKITIEPDSTSINDIHLPVSNECVFSGNGFLSGDTVHGNIAVYLRPQCPFALTDTIYTDAAGHFSKTIPLGHYYLRYSHEGYLPDFTISSVDVFFDMLMPGIFLETGSVHEIEDPLVSGHWLADYPYWIFSDIKIQAGDSLVLDQGVEVIIKRGCKWDVEGTLLANGTEEEHVIIQSDSYYFWGPFSFLDSTANNSKISYADIRYLRGIKFRNASPFINHTDYLWLNEMYFYGSSSPTIETSNLDYALPIYCKDSSSPVIRKNLISHPHIYCSGLSRPKIYNNTFFDCESAIMCFDEANPEIINNIFFDNGYAIDFRFGTAPTVIEYNTFYDEYDTVWIKGGEIPGFGIPDTTNINGDSCDIFFNLFMDPMFRDFPNGDRTLLAHSPCIDAGNPEFDYDPDTTISDIGAYYFDQTNVFVNDWKTHFHAIKVYHYPNPLNENVHFVIDGNEMNDVKNAVIMIYDLSGIKTGELQCPFIDKGFGKKIYNYNCSSFNAGTYIYTLEINGQAVASNKMIIVR